MKKLIKWVAIGFVGLVILSVAVGGESGTDSTSKSSSSSSESASSDSGSKEPSKSSDGGCTNKASGDCTPHVAVGQRVRVDALYWDVTSVDTAKTLGDQTYGLGEKADGTFVVVNLKVTSDKNESATLTDEAVQLEIEGNTYKADSDGTIAAIGDGQNPLFFEDIGPDATLKSKVVFDVPDSKLAKKMSVRFGELGFGDTHGYIDLPLRAS